jgi:hypothetical protein
MLPVREQLVPYARIGVGAMEAKLDAHQFGSQTESDMARNLGADLDLLFTESLSLGLDGKCGSGTRDVDDINYFTGPIRLRFYC